MTTTKRTIHEHLFDALEAFAVQEATQFPELADQIADSIESGEVLQYVDLEATTRKQTRSGRIDTRSLMWQFYLRNPLGRTPRILLCEVLGADLVDAEGQPIDARADARMLLQQQGLRIPNSPEGIENAPPLPPELDDTDGA